MSEQTESDALVMERLRHENWRLIDRDRLLCAKIDALESRVREIEDAKQWNEGYRAGLEAAAKVTHGNVTSSSQLDGTGWKHGYACGREEAAAAIRALGKGNP